MLLPDSHSETQVNACKLTQNVSTLATTDDPDVCMSHYSTGFLPPEHPEEHGVHVSP